MTDLRAAAEAALDALEHCYDVTEYPANGSTQQDAAINGLRAALAAAPAAPPPLPPYIVREARRAIEAAEKPSGMGPHDGKAVLTACYLRRLLAEAIQPPAGCAEFVAWWEALPSDAFGGSIEALAKAAFKAGAAAPAAPAEPRKPLTIGQLASATGVSPEQFRPGGGLHNIARAIERAHGIGAAPAAGEGK